MNHKNLIISIILFFLFGLSQAQTDESYINKLTADIDLEWLNAASESIQDRKVEWDAKEVHGFNFQNPSARKQGILAQWSFYKNNANGNTVEGSEIQFPHNFEKNRNYNSAWYVSKWQIDKQPKKGYFLKLNRVDMFSVLFVNGKQVGQHMGAFTPFEFDITEYLIDGDNVLALFVYDKGAAVDGDRLITQVGPTYLKAGKQGFNLSGGIDDIPVLEVREKTYIKDIFVKTSTRKGEIEIEYEISSNANPSSNPKLSFEILKWPNGEKVELKIPEVESQNIFEGVHSVKAKWDDADLWSPDHPNLYVLRTTLQTGKNKDVLDTRFGFREFWVESKSFMLNGIPIRLRGESNYHPQTSGVDFHREVFNMHKEVFGSNACRIHAFMPHGDIILGADEAGMLLIDQSAVWSVNGQLYAKGGDLLIKNLAQEFEEWVRRDRNCPSVVIWDVENEMLRFNYELHLPWVTQLPGLVKKFDNTRPINLSAAGWYSPDQDMVSLHMQDNYARIMNDWVNKGTTPLIMGEFWVGARASQRLPNAPEVASVHQRYLEEAAAYERNMLEMRYFGVSAIMPFRISILGLKQVPHTTVGYDFTPPNTLKKEKQSDDVLWKLKHALQPVTIFFWPRETYSDAGKPFQRELLICNDSENEEKFTIEWKWDGQAAKTETVNLKPAETQRININEKVPQIATKIIANVSCKNEIVSTDTLLIEPIFLADENPVKTIQVYKDENLATTLSESGFKSFSNENIPDVNDDVLWIIPENANNRELNSIKDKILNYLNEGGNILCLKQDQAPTWFPVKLQFWSANLPHLHTYEAMGWKGLNKDLRYAKYATILAASHPVFSGINNSSLHLWDKFDGRVADDVFSRPSTVNKYEQGNWRPLACAALNTQISLAELFYGKGTMLACQLHVVENLENPQAQKLLANMLSYLFDKKPEKLNNRIALNGSLRATDISALTGADEQVFKGAEVENNDVMLAFDGADLSELKAWAAKGGKVIVLSESISDEFEGVSLDDDVGSVSTASKIADHSLFYGVSSANFQSPLLNGYFSSIPKNAKVLLQGFTGQSDFWRIGEAGPVMISMPYEKGEIVLSTLNINAEANNDARELLCLILTNCGVHVPYIEPTAEEIVIKKTVPITVDGKLNEWLDDMEDRFVSPYVHAQPVYLTSENTIEGPPAFDLKLSVINYFLWNEKALHIAGVIFSEEKNAVSQIVYSAEKEYNQQIRFNNDLISITYKNDQIEITVNGKTSDSVLIETGQLSSKEMTDATRLQFSYISGGGSVSTVASLVGETFEVLIPWDLLKSNPSDESLKTLISIESKGSKLQIPISANPESQADWLPMTMSREAK